MDSITGYYSSIFIYILYLSIFYHHGTHQLTNIAAAAPALNLTPEEKRAYGQLFRQADTDNVGVVTGEIAVKFFEKTRLDSRVLGEVGFDNASYDDDR